MSNWDTERWVMKGLAIPLVLIVGIPLLFFLAVGFVLEKSGIWKKEALNETL